MEPVEQIHNAIDDMLILRGHQLGVAPTPLQRHVGTGEGTPQRQHQRSLESVHRVEEELERLEQGRR